MHTKLYEWMLIVANVAVANMRDRLTEGFSERQTRVSPSYTTGAFSFRKKL